MKSNILQHYHVYAMLGLKSLVEKMHIKQEATQIYIDKLIIALVEENLVHHERSKHIHLRF